VATILIIFKKINWQNCKFSAV